MLVGRETYLDHAATMEDRAPPHCYGRRQRSIVLLLQEIELNHTAGMRDGAPWPRRTVKQTTTSKEGGRADHRGKEVVKQTTTLG